MARWRAGATRQRGPSRNAGKVVDVAPNGEVDAFQVSAPRARREDQAWLAGVPMGTNEGALISGDIFQLSG